MNSKDRNYNNLAEVVQSLPASTYYDPEIYNAELDFIWYRNWIYAGRTEGLEKTGDFRSIRIGSQNLFLITDSENRINGFFNTCRHRGSILCRQEQGNLKSNHISCPYHRWTYSLTGDLIRTPNLNPTNDFDKTDYSLYPVAVKEWSGCVFVNLTTHDVSEFEKTMEPSPNHLSNWPLDDLKIAHTRHLHLHCNWKIFWENFLECYHCPGLHPELCDLVPIYKRTYMAARDDPNWAEYANDSDAKYRGGLREGAASWTMDGKVQGVPFPNLTEKERQSGYIYVQSLPSMFMVAHQDYVRIVSILPDGPEDITLKTQWLLSSESLAKKDLALDQIVDFGMLVLQQDAMICEVNQQGVRSIAHKQGVLMPQEYSVAKFHDWLRVQLSRKHGS